MEFINNSKNDCGNLIRYIKNDLKLYNKIKLR